jgi:4-aminobutyrate aminotransferase/4-aminobutyrate aminotransferase/(S)-3-amino-2-methylpropionate transaminase
MIAIEMVKDRQTKEPYSELPEFFVHEGLRRGAIFGESKYLGLGNVVKIKPPLVINETQVAKVLEVFGTICEDAAKLKR